MIFKYKYDGIVNKIDTLFSEIKRESLIKTVAMFDLTGSTDVKMRNGHTIGESRSIKAVLLTKHIVAEFGGKTIKELGDGILSCFDDPFKACQAALAIRIASVKFNMNIRGGITLGMIDVLNLRDTDFDIYGITVDRCARILACALPGQIIIDRALCDSVMTLLKDYRNIELSAGRKRILKGIGETELYEISTSSFGLKDYIYTQFCVHEEGRIALGDKINFVKDAHSRVIEMGLGLTTFSKWFTGQRPSEFRNYIQDLLAKKVDLDLLLVDPCWELGKEYFLCRGETEYIKDIHRSLELLKNEQERLLPMNLPGRFKIHLYQCITSMHILCVDPDDPVTGRMLVSPYLNNIGRSDCPVYEFSSLSNMELFNKHKESLYYILRHHSRVYE